jgi:hypothetical protein
MEDFHSIMVHCNLNDLGFSVHCNLNDLGFSGSCFTWSNCRHDDMFTKEWLDRALVNFPFASTFS